MVRSPPEEKSDPCQFSDLIKKNANTLAVHRIDARCEHLFLI